MKVKVLKQTNKQTNKQTKNIIKEFNAKILVLIPKKLGHF